MCRPKACQTVVLLIVLLLGVVASAGAPRSKSGTQKQRDVTLEPPTSTLPTAERRTALVIGNAAYAEGRLANPVNDATDMASSLRQMGFAVVLLHDADLRRMRDAIETFRQQLRPGVVGLFYFAGHGLQVKGENYLVPIGARIAREQDVEFETVHVGRILGAMEDAANDVNVIILDACRNNPFTRSFRAFQRGLAVTQAITGSLIAYATAPGSVAADGAGRNGVYTSHLLRHMRIPNVPIEQVFKNVRISVMQETSSKQTPWETSSLTGNFVFTLAAEKPALEPRSPLPPTSGQAVPPGVSSSLSNLQAQVEAQRQQVQAERQQLEEERRRREEYQKLQAEQERLLREEYRKLQTEQERLRQEREKLQGGGAPKGPQVAVGGNPPPPPTPQTSRQSSGIESAPTAVTVELSSPTPGVTFRPQQRFQAVPGKKVKIAAAKQGYLTAEKTILVADHDMAEDLGPLQPQAEGEQGERERRKHQAEETERQRREAEQAAIEHRRQAEETERQRREAEEAEQRKRENILVAQGMKFIVKRQFLCLTTQDNLVVGAVTRTGASSLSCEDARRTLIAEDEKKNACPSPYQKEGQKQWIGTASCPAP
jgi:uncharacterized caspase-like protein